jgi:integrase/recombinase XerD
MIEHVLPVPAADYSSPVTMTDHIPRAVVAAGHHATFAWDEFFAGQLRNPHTRAAYGRAVHSFLDWLEPSGVALTQVTPGIVGTYLDRLRLSTPSKKLALAALRRFFDAIVLRHVLILNPAGSVRGERYEVVEGKTPEATPEQARALLASIDTTTPVGLRDRAVIATLIYTAARAGAVARLRQNNFRPDGTQYVLRFVEKGGKQREIPVRHDLESFLLDYLTARGDPAAPLLPLFRSTVRRTGVFTEKPMTGTDIWRMVKRRLADAGLPEHLSPHSFRVATVTDLLTQGVPRGDVQYLAGHADPRTTRLYDRRPKKVTRNLVDRISI